MHLGTKCLCDREGRQKLQLFKVWGYGGAEIRACLIMFPKQFCFCLLIKVDPVGNKLNHKLQGHEFKSH